jgi:hypothetical protein
MKIESILKSPTSKRYPQDFADFLRYVALIWRRINDAIVWSLFGMEGHYIRRLCLRKQRPTLLEANPKAIMPLLEELNADPLTFALWSDATSCVDIGDIISRTGNKGDVRAGGELGTLPYFLEKRGGVPICTKDDA